MPGETSLSTLLTTLKLSLDPRTFVFLTVPPTSNPSSLPIPFNDIHMLFREKQGITIITTVDVAESHGFRVGDENCFYKSKMITLDVHSSLEAVGFMSVISKKLADEGVNSNPVSAFYHDHLFVKEGEEERAMKVLEELGSEVREVEAEESR